MALSNEVAAKDHLDTIRLRCQSLLDKIRNTDKKPDRVPEIISMVWGILDRVLGIENEVMGTEFYDGQRREVDS